MSVCERKTKTREEKCNRIICDAPFSPWIKVLLLLSNITSRNLSFPETSMI